jgi:hypothetical protein
MRQSGNIKDERHDIQSLIFRGVVVTCILTMTSGAPQEAG